VKDPLATTELVRPTHREIIVGSEPIVQAVSGVAIPMGLCRQCRDRRERAAKILDERPVLAHSLGSRSYGVSLIECILAAYEVLGIPDQMNDQTPIRTLRLAIKNLAAAGAAVAWSAKFAPVLAADAKPDTTAPSRWGHLSEAQLQQVRDAYAVFLRALTYRPALIEPPEEEGGHKALRGCLLCGLAAVKSSHRDAMPWGRLRAAVPSTLGGRGRPQPLRGFVCPTCTASMERSGHTALGANALEAAVFDWLGVQGRDVEVRGLKAWCVTGAAPSSQPWAHLGGNRDTLRKQFAAGIKAAQAVPDRA
jgi:hypothetical protein